MSRHICDAKKLPTTSLGLYKRARPPFRHQADMLAWETRQFAPFRRSHHKRRGAPCIFSKVLLCDDSDKSQMERDVNSQLLPLTVLKCLTNYHSNNANLTAPRQMTLVLARHFSTWIRYIEYREDEEMKSKQTNKNLTTEPPGLMLKLLAKLHTAPQSIQKEGNKWIYWNG